MVNSSRLLLLKLLYMLLVNMLLLLNLLLVNLIQLLNLLLVLQNLLLLNLIQLLPVVAQPDDVNSTVRLLALFDNYITELDVAQMFSLKHTMLLSQSIARRGYK
jgi:hypothetical protein